MSVDWKQRPEGGGRFAVWVMQAVARHGGRALARLLVPPVSWYFLLRRGPERRASIDFLSRALGRRASRRDSARHNRTFGAAPLDRLFLLDGRQDSFRIDVEGLDALAAKVDEGRGLLLFGSHLGSFEAMRALSRTRPGLKLRVVLDKSHSRAITQMLDALAPEIAAGVIDAGQDGPALMLQIQQAASEGAMVALLVDRTLPGQRALAVPFFGEPAPFPMAPWQMAAVLRLPVVLGFGLYRGGNHYELVFEPFSDGIDLARGRRDAALATLIRGYAARLEHHARRAPYNWFNFYDFWHVDDQDPQPQIPAAEGSAPAAQPGGMPVPAGERTLGVGAGQPR